MLLSVLVFNAAAILLSSLHMQCMSGSHEGPATTGCMPSCCGAQQAEHEGWSDRASYLASGPQSGAWRLSLNPGAGPHARQGHPEASLAIVDGTAQRCRYRRPPSRAVIIGEGFATTTKHHHRVIFAPDVTLRQDLYLQYHMHLCKQV